MYDTSLTLYELNKAIKSVINHNFDTQLWIVAEIHNLNLHKSGHCYLELVQKSKSDDSIIAQARATIWASQFKYISSFFRSATNSELSKGMNVMLKVIVDFHEVYGFSLNVRDIDPSYTLGDLERRKKEIIDKLIVLGVYDNNKKLTLPYVIKNIAVISSRGAAGFEDFMTQLENNIYKYRWNIVLFDSDMQGPNTEKSLISSLDLIFEKQHLFDVVCIIRGGGSKADLSFFDNFNIAYKITQFPLPVITGIGHERDESVIDMVAHTKLKTPTAVAEYLINYNYNFEKNIDEIHKYIILKSNEIIKSQMLFITSIVFSLNKTKELIQKQKDSLNEKYYILKNQVKNLLKNEKIKIDDASKIIKIKPSNLISKTINNREADFQQLKKLYYRNLLQIQNNLFNIEKRLKLSDPKNLLMRGFSITKINGKTIKPFMQINKGDIIETILVSRKLYSSITDEKIIEDE